MNAYEPQIDRVARAMTSGAPGETFAARVMAPIQGAPQPGFTGRVMTRLDAPRPRRRIRALQATFAAAGALALLAALWLPGDVALPAASAPELVSARVGEPAFVTPDARPIAPMMTPRLKTHARTTANASAAPVRAAARPPGPERPLYRIAQLEPPAGLAIPAIGPAPPAVAPLERPAALFVPGLRFEKENR